MGDVENAEPKRRRGRPCLGDERMVNFSVVVPAKVREAIRDLAAARGKSKSGLVREIIVDYLFKEEAKKAV